MSDLRKFALGARGSRGSSSNPTDFTPVKWNKYFDTKGSVQFEDDTFHYYLKGTTGPVLVTIHGGGYSALTWALFAEEITSKVQCQILAMDLRGHGSTVTANDEDMSLSQLADDVAKVISQIYDGEKPQIILVGHSLGGAVVVESAQFLENLIGVCVIDVVEGTALDSLSSMQSILRGRPNSFKSIGHAIQWGFRGGSTHNIEAARISMPGQIKCAKTNKIASEIVYETPDAKLASHNSVECSASGRKPPVLASSISEENEEESTNEASAASGPTRQNSAEGSTSSAASEYKWRIDLTKTEKYWSGWFNGLSDKFLNIPGPKILLLANIHGLDTRLTIGQMQGRFQLQVLPKSGHAIHEDQPGQVADIISTFLVRQKLAEPIGEFTCTRQFCTF